jgi:glycolate oxidase iron-sulfur subunit
MSADGQPAEEAGQLRKIIGDCVHCGFCLPACPTYQLWGEEMDSPRGRIHLMAQMLDGAQPSQAAAEHLDRCLGCMACVPACPSGVRYDTLIEAARSWASESGEKGAVPGAAALAEGAAPAWPPALPPRSRRDRAVRAAIFATFPYPRRLSLIAGPLRAAQRTGFDRLLRRSTLLDRAAPELAAALRVAPRPAPRRTADAEAPAPPLGPGRRLPERVAARGNRRAVVGMLTGCVQRVFFPQVNVATARVLAAEGCDVVIPADQGCCGALSLHDGRRAQAARFARATIETFERAGVDAVVINSAGCGSAMKEYPALLADVPGDRSWAERAEAIAAKVADLSEFLADLGPTAIRHPLPLTVAYHDACHLAHAQRITRQPRDLLQAIPGLAIADIADAGTCCGSAGIYNLVQPRAARELGARKASAVAATGADLLVSGNPGCSLQIAAALDAAGRALPVAHLAEVLDASIHARHSVSDLRASSTVPDPRASGTAPDPRASGAT